jgi:hypothetical protein
METTTVALLGGTALLVALVALVAGVRWRRRSAGGPMSGGSRRATTSRHETRSTTERTDAPASTTPSATTRSEDPTPEKRSGGLAADVEKQLSDPVRRSSTSSPDAATASTTSAGTDTTTDDSGSLDDLWADSTTLEGDGDDLDAASEALLAADTDDDWEIDAPSTTAGDEGLFESSGEPTDDYCASTADDGSPDDDLDSLFS